MARQKSKDRHSNNSYNKGYNNGYDKGYDDGYKQGCNEDDSGVYLGFFFFGAILGVGILLILLFIAGEFDTPLNELNMEDIVAKNYIVKYYPEFKDCDIQYKIDTNINEWKQISGVWINCNNLGNRDGLIISNDESSVTKIEFKDITLEQMFEQQLREFKKTNEKI